MEGEDAAIESALFFKNGFPDTHRLTRANLGDGGSAEYLTNAQNLHIACYFWPASPCFLRDQPGGRGHVDRLHRRDQLAAPSYLVEEGALDRRDRHPGGVAAQHDQGVLDGIGRNLVSMPFLVSMGSTQPPYV